MGRLSGKVALITGAASGMGAASARLFVEEGAKVLLTDVNMAGEVLASQLGDGAAFAKLDVSSEAAWVQAIGQAEERFGRLDILVNSAGIAIIKPLWQTTVDECRRQFEINQLGLFLGIKAAVDPMTRAGGGSIVNISSGAGLRACPTMAFYSATKFAVRGITKSAAAELAPFKIRVNTIIPGAIDTPLLQLNSQEFNDVLVGMTPLKRLGQASEIAEAALFLASDAAGFTTGTDLTVDGGGTI